MKHLINREDYIKEYLNNSRYLNNENELDEGLLSSLFGGLKMLLKKDWDNIKCKNPSVIEYLKEIDKSLSGYTMTKMQYSSECNTIRQNVADYFNDILNYKLLQVEKAENVDKFIEKEDKENDENKESNSISKLLNLKDKTLLDTLNKYKDNISIACKKSSKLKEYAKQMLNSVEVFVNDIVIKELEKKGADKEKLEKKRKELEEKKKKIEDVRKKMDDEAKKANEEDIKKLSKERDDAMRDLGIKPIGAMSGDKAVEDISKQFSDMMKEFKDVKLNESALPKGIDKILSSDTFIGIKQSLNELNLDFEDKNKGLKNKLLLKVILNKINTVFEVILKNKEMFKEVSSASVQAMMVSLSNAVIYGFIGDEFKIDDNRLSLMTKCAIDSDATIGFNLPLIEPEKPENGNFFVSVMNQFKSTNINSKEIEDAIKSMNEKDLKKIAKEVNIKFKDISGFIKEYSNTLMKDFRQNITNLLDMIVKKAKDLKEIAAKERENESKNVDI